VPVSPPIPILHAVTSDEIAARPGFLERATAVMRAAGCRGALHLRTHRLSAAEMYGMAELLAVVQAESGCWLVINDRVDVALAAGARGIQLTSRSMRVADARAIAPAIPVGASVHSADDAAAAQREGAAWTIAGHVYDTESHQGETGRGTSFIAGVCGRTTLPVIAIGGIRPADVGALRRAGAWGVAVIRGIWSARDAEAAATDYLSRYDADGGS
jgi:thiazole tautomerase (transcriptional regulator TenI)